MQAIARVQERPSSHSMILGYVTRFKSEKYYSQRSPLADNIEHIVVIIIPGGDRVFSFIQYILSPVRPPALLVDFRANMLRWGSLCRVTQGKSGGVCNSEILMSSVSQ